VSVTIDRTFPDRKGQAHVTAASKRASKAIGMVAFAAVMAACTFSAPTPSKAAGPVHAQTALGGVLTGTSVLPTAVETTVITTDLKDLTLGRYGTRTKGTFSVKASGSDLRYRWQQHSSSSTKWKTISGAKARTYTVKATTWPSGTRVRVVVTGKLGTAVSATAKLTVLLPTKTPAKDAETAFGLTGLRQGVDLSAYQYTPAGRVKLKAIAEWAGADGFTILRNGSGARPIKQKYTDACTNQTRKTGTEPVTEDCAYARLADASRGQGLSLGHYWFNGWIASIDTTKKQLFAGGFTPEASAATFVTYLKADGHYTRTSTDPLVLDIEAGHAWTKTSGGKKYRVKLRAWKPAEAAAFLTAVKQQLTAEGYQANLYVYMSANAAAKQSDSGYAWADVASLARLWVASWGTNNGRIPDAEPKVGPWADQDGWSIWQYTSNARIAGDGISTGLDGDIAKSDAWTPR
jgi:hypothetical protein